MRSLKSQIDRYIRKWVPIIGLSHWDIKIGYKSDKESKVYATATTHYKYNELYIEFNVPKVLEIGSRIEVEKLVLHELCHAPLSALSCNATGHRSEKMVSYLDEQATSTFAQAIWRAYHA